MLLVWVHWLTNRKCWRPWSRANTSKNAWLHTCTHTFQACMSAVSCMHMAADNKAWLQCKVGSTPVCTHACVRHARSETLTLARSFMHARKAPLSLRCRLYASSGGAVRRCLSITLPSWDTCKSHTSTCVNERATPVGCVCEDMCHVTHAMHMEWHGVSAALSARFDDASTHMCMHRHAMQQNMQDTQMRYPCKLNVASWHSWWSHE